MPEIINFNDEPIFVVEDKDHDSRYPSWTLSVISDPGRFANGDVHIRWTGTYYWAEAANAGKWGNPNAHSRQASVILENALRLCVDDPEEYPSEECDPAAFMRMAIRSRPDWVEVALFNSGTFNGRALAEGLDATPNDPNYSEANPVKRGIATGLLQWLSEEDETVSDQARWFVSDFAAALLTSAGDDDEHDYDGHLVHTTVVELLPLVTKDMSECAEDYGDRTVATAGQVQNYRFDADELWAVIAKLGQTANIVGRCYAAVSAIANLLVATNNLNERVPEARRVAINDDRGAALDWHMFASQAQTRALLIATGESAVTAQL